MSISWYKALSLCVLCALHLPGVLSQNQTSPASVQGLLAFKAKVRDVQGVLASWNSSSTPCSTSDCSSSSNTEDCTWAGIACQAGQVVALAMPCTVLSTGATGACALQGSPLDSLVQVTSLKLLDLSGNALQGTLPVAFASSLQSLSVLLLGSNLLTGPLPSAWSSMTNLSVADLGDNRFYGTLPPSYGAWTNMKGLRLTSNSLTGYLPAAYGNWTSIQELELGGNDLFGTVPSSWASMVALQDLELDYNCGLCGSLPTFPMQASGQLSVDTSHSSIGSNCGDSNCASSNLGLVLRTVIGVAVICAVLLVVGLRSWQLRRRRRLGYDVRSSWEFRLQNRIRRLLGMQPLVVPVISRHQAHHRSRDTEMAASHTSRRRRIKQEQPTLVIMPDGHSLCFAVRDGPASASSQDKVGNDANTTTYTNPLADPNPLRGYGTGQHQQQSGLEGLSAAGADRGESSTAASADSDLHTLPGSTAAGGS